MADQPLPTSIPPTLHRFFWDVDAAKLNPSEHPLYVINRLLDKGNLEAARWVLRNFTKDTIITSMKTGPAMSTYGGGFWAHYFDIPREKMTPMIPSHRVPTGIWRYA